MSGYVNEAEMLDKTKEERAKLKPHRCVCDSSLCSFTGVPGAQGVKVLAAARLHRPMPSFGNPSLVTPLCCSLQM
jgi:hypothetical protein